MANISDQRRDLDIARYSGYIKGGSKDDGKYLKDASIKQTQVSTNILYSGSKSPTGTAVIRNALWFDYDGKKIYVGTDSGSWAALV